MIAIHRRTKIKELLFQERSVKVADLVKEFSVSEETIRRDLNQLEQDGIIQKNYGGAILLEELQTTSQQIPPVEQRKFQYYEEKDAIGKMAASLVVGQEIVILDSGSTTWCVARHLRHVSNLMVVTNGLNVAEESSQNEEASVFVIGGKLIKKSMSLVGPQAELELQKYNADFSFLGASGISKRKGFTSSDLYEAEVKRAMIAAGQKIVIVADHSKFERQGLISFSSFQDVDILVTSDLVEQSLLDEISQLGVEVMVCPVKHLLQHEDE
ncbi:DeoR/GlpR family DNA-binding transcription regulator [Paenibacillus qinlingensis]|uniref:DeoR family transcriptional regulator of aga operon/DeoR family myo-inositol catabolism operon transcriptional repressor n=1 Tax=Paenibacillus qinlingensis TaxID=1837343 RepID=A0ABU1P0M6_9BACL|nr:DeoR/GlpR family DNA-binding transcription regulator [Paenibacillus qinlingensis]MDR6553124.1 DeoR family transcriptional regulator of aga operon/DeoR family myo-inositol catabolism operon transcriptional repressor [Paenibacillus qinlingensis]